MKSIRAHSIFLTAFVTLTWSFNLSLRSQAADGPAPFVSPKSQSNAVDYYQKAYAIVQALDESDARRYRAKTLDQNAPQLIRQLQDAIRLVRTGSGIRTATWPSSENAPGQSIIMGKIVRSCSDLLVYTARHELEQGETEQAIRDLMGSLAVARHASEKPNMMVKLIEIGATRKGISTLAAHLPTFPRELVLKIQEQLKQLLPSPSAAEVIRKEYQFGIKEAARQDKLSGRQDNFSSRNFSPLKDYYEALASAASLPPSEFISKIEDQNAKHLDNPMASHIGKLLQSFQGNTSVSKARFAMLETGIQIILNGEAMVTKSNDPSGNGPFTLEKNPNGFVLSSQLKYRDQSVTIRFGLAATNP